MRDANIATLMLDGPRTQTTPADEPAEEAGHEPEVASRRERTADRVAHMSANSAARAIRAVHSLAWEGRVGRLHRPLPSRCSRRSPPSRP